MARRQFSKEDIIKKLDNSLDFLDEKRAAILRKAHTIQQANVRALELEQMRLAEKYGANHTRVKRISARLPLIQEFMKSLDAEIERSNIKVPKFKAGSWRIHGRVHDKDLRPISGLIASLIDANGQLIREFEAARTDEKGYFAITVSDQDGTLRERYKDQSLFLYITEQDGEVVCKSLDPLRLAIGKIDFRRIILGTSPCEDIIIR